MLLLLLLPAAVAILRAHPAACLDQSFTADGDIRHFVVAANRVYVATGEMMYQLSPELSPVQSVIQRGYLTGCGDDMKFDRVPEARSGNATFSVNVLLPFVKNGTVISCGTIGNKCDRCEVLDSKNISSVLYKEGILLGPARAGSASVAFLVDVQAKSPETYIMTAIQQQKYTSSSSAAAAICSSRLEAAYLHNTNNGQNGGIFSVIDVSSNALFKRKDCGNFVDFVDGFQIGQDIYLFSNVDSRVRLLWLVSIGSKFKTLKSMRGASLQVSGRLLASSVLPGGDPVLWSGVFSTEGEEYNTELLLFDISANRTGGQDMDPDFCALACGPSSQKPKTLTPKATLFRQNNMTSVLAVRRKTWMVFYIGTGDGQLIKLSVDKNYRPMCPRSLYKFNDDRQVFPKIYLDEVGQKHVFAAFGNQVRRVPVSNCNAHKSLEECWSARDPDCVWCGGDRSSCVFADECEGSDWLSSPDVDRPKMISFSVARGSGGQITLRVHTHLSAGREASDNFACQISGRASELCSRASPRPLFPQCTCILSNSTIPAEGLTAAVKIRLGTTGFQDRISLLTCTDISGPPTPDLCQRCIEAGCDWIGGSCSWSTGREIDDQVCRNSTTQTNFTKPEISSITPSVVSFFGKNHAVLSGRNLRNVARVRIHTAMGCVQRESPVWNNTGGNLTFHIPRADKKGIASVCLLLPDGSCHGNAKVTYVSAPSCDKVTPNRTWMSGKRVITLTGSHLDISEGILHSHAQWSVTLPASRNPQEVTYLAPAGENIKGFLTSTVMFKVVNESIACPMVLTYYPDPKFTKYTSTVTGRDVKITIQKEADKLEMSEKELAVWGVRQGVEYPCEMEPKDTNNKTEFFICVIKNIPNSNFEHVKIMYGEKTKTLMAPSAQKYFLMLLVFLLIPIIVIAVVIFYRSKQKKLANKMNRLMENLELDIRNDIRQGFVDLQTEKTDLLENVGTIPFLDYKHFASRIFFPENDILMALCVTDIGQVATKVELDDSCRGLSRLLQDQLFLTSMVHALEAEKSFTIKDKCTLASLLTVALHGNLSYLTEVIEILLKALMQQNSNTQPKLLLRRTESTVEKLLTNWMSICLYGFLRESVGQHLFLMVSALTQQITKGPVDCVTEKALYTLSEDWLLWQAQEFCSVRLNVLFAVGSDGEVSEPLEVNALDCDTVEQVKEKILTAFKAKFGFHFDSPLKEISIEYERDGSFVPLQEVDASSEVIGEVKMLNTLKHYKVSDGAKIKVLSKKSHPPLTTQRSVKDDENFSGKYFHLIDPDVDEHQRQSPERKKLKVKEVHLTKLLSTKVAVHSFVENLFRSIWGLPQCKAPHAVKYFFDFLDAQADNMKITDPDVLHIWKTNSLPLRCWINILKNPQFVFDMEKTPHLDGCLSVIAQAFMDSFSLSEMQLGKHAPTNKLLYAKDIPKFKQEVKTYYKQIREQSTITDSDFKVFLKEESKKHENEFNEAAALREIFKYVQKYFNEILEKLDQNGAPTELTEQLHHIKNLFDEHKSAAWS